MGRICKEIEEADSLKKGEYLSFSEQCLIAIRDSDRATLKRARFLEEWRDKKKKLKNARIKKYGIVTDELTGDLLEKRTAEFSHIRSSSLYRDISENGLIVNKNTHELITASGVNDEEELIFLCDQEGWSTTWYDEYKEYLRNRME